MAVGTDTAFLLIGAAVLATYVFAQLFEEEAQKAYTIGRMARGILWTGFAALTVIVFVSTGNPVLILFSIVLVVFLVLYLVFDYYSPVSDI